MALSIKNQSVEKLLDQVTKLTGESKTEAIRKALEVRKQSLMLSQAYVSNASRLLAFLDDEIWPQIPAELLGTYLSKEDEEEILGFGELGV